jgi:hypothetical protein
VGAKAETRSLPRVLYDAPETAATELGFFFTAAELL